MRFPILVLFFYLVQFSDLTYEKEIEEDTVELIQEALVDESTEAMEEDLSVESSECLFEFPEIVEPTKTSFVKTAYLKLYILYSNFSIDDECCPTFA